MPRHAERDAWVRRLAALVVAGVAAYASYVHQHAFARQGGADPASAALWPLSVDGLLLLATIGLLKQSLAPLRGRVRCLVWLAFMLGIAVSLAANIAAAPALAWKPMLVAGWPPVALLFAVELMIHDGSRRPEGAAGQERVAKQADAGDPLLTPTRDLDTRHRELHHRPISAATLRKELHISSERARCLVKLVRENDARQPT